MADYEKAVEIEPRLWQAWKSLCVLHSTSRDSRRCLESLGKLIEYSPASKKWVCEQPFFEWLQSDPQFQVLVAE
jgi:hypothetical protein